MNFNQFNGQELREFIKDVNPQSNLFIDVNGNSINNCFKKSDFITVIGFENSFYFFVSDLG